MPLYDIPSTVHFDSEALVEMSDESFDGQLWHLHMEDGASVVVISETLSEVDQGEARYFLDEMCLNFQRNIKR